MLGATKRLAEMYCRRHWTRPPRSADGGKIADPYDRGAGSVTCSRRRRRSVVPKFKAQIEARRSRDRDPSRHGPLFHDHPRKPAISSSHRSESCAWPNADRRPRSMCSTWVSRSRSSLDLAPNGMIRLSGLEAGARHRHRVYRRPAAARRLNEILFAREEPGMDVGGSRRPWRRHRSVASIDVVRDWVAKLKSGIDAQRTRRRSVCLQREAVPDYRSARRDNGAGIALALQQRGLGA